MTCRCPALGVELVCNDVLGPSYGATVFDEGSSGHARGRQVARYIKKFLHAGQGRGKADVGALAEILEEWGGCAGVHKATEEEEFCRGLT